MKKKIIVSTVFAFAGISCYTQQRPQYTQYILNNYILNPALSGIENYIDVKISARDQWVGLNGAPQTFYLTAHGPIGKKDYKTTATSYSMHGQNPRGQSYWQNYTASEPHHGIGFAMINDKTGLYSRFTADLSYAYHLGLSARTNIAAGFSAGISRIGYDRSKAQLVDPNDPLVIFNSREIDRIRPDLNAGIWVYAADYFIGLSAQQVIPQKIKFSDDASFEGSKFIPHFFVVAGYRFLVNDDINAVPAVMLKYIQGTPARPQFDFNLKMQYRDLLWVGGSFRLKEGYAAMIGLNVGNTFNVGYAYDYSTTQLNTVSHGTHELIIGFLVGNHYGDTCPRNVW